MNATSMESDHNIVSLSGGKDSTATLLVAIAEEQENIAGVFADTGNEHTLTYDYIDYLQHKTGIPIQRVKADFSREIEQKRRYIEKHWAIKGVSQLHIERALHVLHPTGIPFLDLCLWKGRFPSAKTRFCTDELKVKPMLFGSLLPRLSGSNMVLSWQGVRRDESLKRRYLHRCDEVGAGLFNYRPILDWSVSDVFDAHKYMGIKPNPLYLQDMDRVGCMPCIMCRKDELRVIAARFPEEIERIEEWERLVSMANKQGATTFFTATNDPTVAASDDIAAHTHGITRMVEWSKTTRGGRQFDLIASTANLGCSSSYGLCDSGGLQ